MSNHHECLNCNEKLVGNFCYNCGQKADTHRITTKHFLFHDILHGVWHIDKGILFTLKEAIVRPGQAALDYIKGKRIKYYNVFYLCLILLGLNMYIRHLYVENLLSHESNNASLSHFFEKYVKIIIFSIIPLLAVNSLISFKKMKMNIAEHSIVSGICLLLLLLLTLCFQLFQFLDFVPSLKTITSVGFYTYQVLMFIAPTYVFCDFARKEYSKGKLLLNLLLFNFLMLTELLVLIYITSKVF